MPRAANRRRIHVPSLPAKSSRFVAATSTGALGAASPVPWSALVRARDVGGAQPAFGRGE